jgi:hypothetical protein
MTDEINVCVGVKEKEIINKRCHGIAPEYCG